MLLLRKKMKRVSPLNPGSIAVLDENVDFDDTVGLIIDTSVISALCLSIIAALYIVTPIEEIDKGDLLYNGMFKDTLNNWDCTGMPSLFLLYNGLQQDLIVP